MIPNQHLIAAGKQFPAAWRLADEFRASRGADLPKWPAWCFMPMAGWFAIASDGADMSQITTDHASATSHLAALGAWRVSQGIYQFDPDVEQSLVDTTLTGEIPTDVLYRLPEWCLYIETPGQQWMDIDLHGFWVHLEWDANTERSELRFLLNTPDQLIPQILHMGPWTVTEAVDRAMGEARKQAESRNVELLRVDDAPMILAGDLQPLLARVMYLCSDEPDIVDRDQPGYLPGRPKPKKTKKGWRLFPPAKPRVWSVGDSVGDTLRSVSADAGDSDRKSPRPHLRRAHWHGYWTGPRDGDQKFRCKWLPPTVIRGAT